MTDTERPLDFTLAKEEHQIEDDKLTELSQKYLEKNRELYQALAVWSSDISR